MQGLEYNPRLFLYLLIFAVVVVYAYQFATQLSTQWMVAGVASLGLLAGVAILVWPFEAVMLFLALSICHNGFVRGQTTVGMGSALVYPMDLFVAAFFVLEFFRGCMRQTHLYSMTDRWVLAFFVWVIMCIARGLPDYKNSAYGESREFIAVIAYFVTIHYVNRRERADKAVKWLMWIAVISSVVQLYNFVFINQFAPRFAGGGPLAIFANLNVVTLAVLLGRDHIKKPLSVLPIAVAVGCVLLAAILYFLNQYTGDSVMTWLGLPAGAFVVWATAFILQYRVPAAIALMLQIAIVLYSGQRAATTGMLSTLPFLLWIGRRHFPKAVLLGILSVVLFFAWIMLMNPSFGGQLVPYMERQFIGILSPSDDPTAAWRLHGWKWEMARVFSNPFWVLIGQSFGGYYEWYFSLTDEVIRTAPHNVYVQIWSKQGVVGLGLFLIVFGTFFRECFRFLTRSQNETHRSVVMILMLMTMGYLIAQVGGQFVVGIWVLLALGGALCRLWLAEPAGAPVARTTAIAPQHHREQFRGRLGSPVLAQQRFQS